MSHVTRPPIRLRETLAFGDIDSEAAWSDWGFNCGPAAACAVLGLRPSDIRPWLGDFESKRYTNPSMMRRVLTELGVRFRVVHQSDLEPTTPVVWPLYGLVRIQWDGPWTAPGVPLAARYRKSHWIAYQAASLTAPASVFDINAIKSGGWISEPMWRLRLVPWIVTSCVEQGTGRWWPTHCYEVLGRR